MRPEDYWISLGENVIGLDVLRDGESARQYATYKAIVDWIIDDGLTSVLDIGCNYTILAILLRKAGYPGWYMGIDTNPHALEEAFIYWGRDSYVAFHRMDLRDLSPQRIGIHPCVVVKDVIEHLESIEPLREAFRVSSQYVIISTYLPWHDAPSLIIQHPDGYYMNTYNRAEVEALAAECGFECVETIGVKEADGTPNEITVWRRN